MGRSPPLSKKALLEWAAEIIAKEASAGTYGTITIHLEAGTIVRARIERSEMPQRAEN